ETARRECIATLEELRRLDVPGLSFQAYFLLGQIEETAGNRPGAYASYQEARQLLETLRGSLWRGELKIALLIDRLQGYEALVALCLQESGRNWAEEAFSYMEQAKSRSLMDLLFRARPARPASAAVESDLVRRIRDLREEVNWYYRRIESEQLGKEEASP